MYGSAANNIIKYYGERFDWIHFDREFQCVRWRNQMENYKIVVAEIDTQYWNCSRAILACRFITYTIFRSDEDGVSASARYT